MKLEHFLKPYAKINSKWIKDLNVKLLEENKTLYNINQSKFLYDPPPGLMEMKTKIKKWELIKFKSLHNKGNYKQDEKITPRAGENDSKQSNWWRINLQNIQTAHAAQYQKNEQPNPKVGKRPK